jgi:hypothetical protein
VNEKNVARKGFKFAESVCCIIVDEDEIVIVKTSTIDVHTAKNRNPEFGVFVSHERFAKWTNLR